MSFDAKKVGHNTVRLAILHRASIATSHLPNSDIPVEIATATFSLCAGTTSGFQYNLPSCFQTFEPFEQCGVEVPVPGSCCPIGFSCMPHPDEGILKCTENTNATFNFAPSSCALKLPFGEPCGALTRPSFSLSYTALNHLYFFLFFQWRVPQTTFTNLSVPSYFPRDLAPLPCTTATTA